MRAGSLVPSSADAPASFEAGSNPVEFPNVSYRHLARRVSDVTGWLIEARTQLAQRTASVHLHANGFVKVTLPDSAGPIIRRLHIWHPLLGSSSCESNVHSHCWPLVSRIVAGTLVEELFAATPVGGGFQEYAFRGQTSRLCRTKSSGLQQLETLVHMQGDVYVRDSHVLHRVKPAFGCLAVSAVAHTRKRVAEARVFMPSTSAVGPNAVALSDDQRSLVASTLQEVETRLRAGGSGRPR